MLRFISRKPSGTVSELRYVSTQPGHLFSLCLLPRQPEGLCRGASPREGPVVSLTKPPGRPLLSVTLAYPDWRQQSERLPVPAAMASAALILAGLHLHHLERGDSDLFPESTFPPHNRERSHNGNSAIEGPGMLLVVLAWPQHSSVRREQQGSYRCLETPAPVVPHLDRRRIHVWRTRKAQCSDVGSLLALVLPGVPSFNGDNMWKPHPVAHALVGFLSKSLTY